MKSKQFLVSTLAVSVSSCGVMGIGAPASGMRCAGTCDITVPVTVGGTGGCTIGPITLNGQPANVVKVGPRNQPTILKWQISGDNQFKFKQGGNAIAFDKSSGAPPSSIMQNGAGGGRSATINDNHSSATTQGSWDYSIYVTGNGEVNCKLDPTVVNDDGSSS